MTTYGVVGAGRQGTATAYDIARFSPRAGSSWPISMWKLPFAAMERTTGFHMAIVAQALGQGNVPVGAIPPELAVTPTEMVRELAKRDIQVKVSERV